MMDDAILQAANSLDDAILQAANWILELLEEGGNLERAIGLEITHADIKLFQDTVATPFIVTLKANISSRLDSSGDIVSALSIFDPRKAPLNSENMSHYGEDSIRTLLAHYGVERCGVTLQGEETVKAALISSDVFTEWITFRQFMFKQPKDDMLLQLKELASNEMLENMFPKLAKISISIPVTTALVERSFSQMKMIKNSSTKHIK